MSRANLIDTSRHGWEPLPGIPGFKRQLLRTDAACAGTVELQYAPPGFGTLLADRSRPEALLRHYHRTVTERLYFLAGDLPNCDWNDLDDREGTVTVFRRHMLLDRPPLTLHGLAPGRVPEVGSTYLVWNTGPGTSLWEPEAARETVILPPDAGREWNADFTQPRIVEVDRLPAAVHPSVTGWRQKLIAADVAHAPRVTVVLVPPGSPAPRVPPVCGGASHWLFVLSGDLTMTLVDSQGERRVTLHEGAFLDLPSGVSARAGGSAHDDVPASDSGCAVICVGHALAGASMESSER